MDLGYQKQNLIIDTKIDAHSYVQGHIKCGPPIHCDICSAPQTTFWIEFAKNLLHFGYCLQDFKFIGNIWVVFVLLSPSSIGVYIRGRVCWWRKGDLVCKKKAGDERPASMRPTNRRPVEYHCSKTLTCWIRLLCTKSTHPSDIQDICDMKWVCTLQFIQPFLSQACPSEIDMYCNVMK